jgi:regulator of sigma E protease
VVGYGKQLKMIFSPSTGYKQGVVLKPYLIFSKYWDWERSDYHSFIINYAWSNEPITYSSTDGGHVMFLLYEIISGKKPSDKFLENAQMVGFVLLISLLLFANGNDIYKAIVGSKKQKCNFIAQIK